METFLILSPLQKEGESVLCFQLPRVLRIVDYGKK
jgi:hypothetical protein